MKLTSATQVLEVKIGEAVTTTAPTFEIEAVEVVAATVLPKTSPSTSEKGDFTASYATAAAAPTSGNQKGVTRIVVANIDSVAHTFFLRTNDSSTFTYELPGTTLQPGEFGQYEAGSGWSFFDVSANRK